MKTKEKVMHDAEGIVEYRTNLKGWVGKDGLFYGEYEDRARWANSTHKLCDCGKETGKSWTKCEWCRSRESIERYKALEFKKWDGKYPLCDWGGIYFFDADELYQHCEDSELKPSELMLTTCIPMPIPEVGDHIWEDWGTEDEGVFEIYSGLSDEVDKLNKYIRELKPRVWEASKFRTELSDKDFA